MKACLSATDWQTDQSQCPYSPSLGVHKTEVQLHTTALRSLCLVERRGDTRKTLFTRFSDTSVLPTELNEVPASLWATQKYDAGLIKGAESVKITPKSDFRPNLPQYPLQQEAIDCITPVFDALLEAGVIVPCPDSPCPHAIVPCQKGPSTSAD